MCCLKYENDEYENAKELLPDLGESIHTSHGEGVVVGLNLLERVIQIELSEQQKVIEYTLDEIVEEGVISSKAAD